MNTAEILHFHSEERHVKADLKSGFAQISFDLIKCLAMRNLTAYQTRLLWVVIEECYSLHKYDFKHISLNTLERGTDLDRRHIVRAKKELLTAKILIEKDGAVGINRNTWEWAEAKKEVPHQAPGVPHEAPKGVPVEEQKGVPVEEPHIDSKEDRLDITNAGSDEHGNKEAEKPSLPAKQNTVWLDKDASLQGITPQMIEKWGAAYPAISVQVEIAKAESWLMANPKNRKKNYLRFLVNWFSNAQERAPRVGNQAPARQPSDADDWMGRLS